MKEMMGKPGGGGGGAVENSASGYTVQWVRMSIEKRALCEAGGDFRQGFSGVNWIGNVLVGVLGRIRVNGPRAFFDEQII